MGCRRVTSIVALFVLAVLCTGCAAQGCVSDVFADRVADNENITSTTCYASRVDLVVREGATYPELIRIKQEASVQASSSNYLEVSVDSDNGDPKWFAMTKESGDYEVRGDSWNAQYLTPGNSMIRIQLENVNDNPAVIIHPEGCTIQENWRGVTGCNFKVTDLDGYPEWVQMEIEDPHFAFRLLGDREDYRGSNEAIYQLEVLEDLDYEQNRVHPLVIRATDNGQYDESNYLYGSPLITTTSFFVYVEDMPDEPPIWQQVLPSIFVLEKEHEQDVQFKAMDGDMGVNWDIRYNLQFPEEDWSDLFAIHEETGLLSVLWIDRDALRREIFKLSVVAVEVIPEDEREQWEDDKDLPMTVEQEVVVIVEDKNDHIPEITPAYVEILEVEEEKPFKFQDIFVEDPDLADNGRFSVSLEPNLWSNNFALVPGEGYQSSSLTLSVLDPSIMDYEDTAWQKFTLKLIVVEAANENHTSAATLYIELKNLNDEFPEFVHGENVFVDVSERVRTGHLVLIVNATDPDGDIDKVTFSMQHGSMMVNADDGSITSATDNTIDYERQTEVVVYQGLITTTTDNTFDYERQTQVVIQVVATDLVGHRAFCTVTILVEDVNDEPPEIVMPYNFESVNEHSPVGTVVVSGITASDPDTTADLHFTIDWDASSVSKLGVPITDSSLFRDVLVIEALQDEDDTNKWNADIVVADQGRYDFEAFDTLRLVVWVVDLNTDEEYMHNYRRSVTVSILVNDINDNAPEFTYDRSANYSIEENSRSGIRIGLLSATDADSYPNNVITFFLFPIESVPAGLVEAVEDKGPQIDIDEVTGELYVAGAIDCEAYQVHVYNVTATDCNEYTEERCFNTIETITIYIIDQNDEIPILDDPKLKEIQIEIYEKTNILNEEIFCVSAADRDVTSPYNVIYYDFNNRNYGYDATEYFSVTSDTGCLVVLDGMKLNRDEDETEYEMIIRTRDNYEDGFASGNSNLGDETKITVKLLDINDHVPEFNSLGTTEIDEYGPGTVNVGDIVLEVTVNDPDFMENGTVVCEWAEKMTINYPSDRQEVEDLFSIEYDDTVNSSASKEKKCTVRAVSNFIGNWGRYTLHLKAYDKGAVKEYSPEYSTHDYDVTIRNVNLRSPTIINPTDKQNILLSMHQNPFDRLKDISGKYIDDFIAIDEDDPETNNGKVWFTLQGSGAAGMFYVASDSSNNTAYLTSPLSILPENQHFSLTLKAADLAQPPLQNAVDFDVYVLNLDTNPTFPVEEMTVQFSENQKGVDEGAIPLQEAVIDAILLPEKYKKTIYYYIIAGDDDDLFQITMSDAVPQLSLRKTLDYEVTSYELSVLATYEKEKPTHVKEDGSSVLRVKVQTK